MYQLAKLLISSRSQVVRLSAAFRFDVEEVFIRMLQQESDNPVLLEFRLN